MDRENLFKDVDVNLLQRWKEFHIKNPEVYEHFKVETWKVHGKGFKHYSAWTLLTAIRYQYDLQTDRVESEFKINNDFVALYARKFLYDYPHMEGFFELRSMKKRKSYDDLDKGDDMKGLNKAVIGLMFFIFGAVAMAATPTVIHTVEITASGGAPIPAAFDHTDPQSLVQSSAGDCRNLKIVSTLTVRCYLKFSNDGTSSPASTVDGSHVIPAGPVTDYADILPLKKFWFLRCTGAPTVGDIVLQCF